MHTKIKIISSFTYSYVIPSLCVFLSSIKHIRVWSHQQYFVGKNGPLSTGHLLYVWGTSLKETQVTFKASTFQSFLLVSMAVRETWIWAKSECGTFSTSCKTPEHAVSYWDDWISSVKYCWEMLNVTFSQNVHAAILYTRKVNGDHKL